MVKLLIGTIGSGKSLYSRQEVKKGSIVINDDAVVTALHGGNYKEYDNALKKLYKSVETSILTHSIAMGLDVIIDKGLLLTKSSRKRWLGLAESFDIPAVGICFPFSLPETHAERRMGNDGRGHDKEYWTKVCRHHQEIYEEPTLDEGFSEILQARYVNGEILISQGSNKCSNRFY